MSEKISFIYPEGYDRWAQYGLSTPEIVFQEGSTRYKAIIKNDELVAILGKGYLLFPNEEALKIADSSAKLAGLVPFDPSNVPGIKSEDHVLYSDNGHKIRAIYTAGKVDKVDGDEVNVGVNVFNAIDGSSSLGCGLFTFRSICSNGVIFGYEKVMSMRMIHTKGLEAAIDDLKNRMVLVMEYGHTLIETYRAMAAKRATNKMVNHILSTRIPAKVLPDYITEEEATLPDISAWGLYNDVTEAIWHNEKAGMKTKTIQFGWLHRAVDRWELT